MPQSSAPSPRGDVYTEGGVAIGGRTAWARCENTDKNVNGALVRARALVLIYRAPDPPPFKDASRRSLFFAAALGSDTGTRALDAQSAAAFRHACFT